MAFTTTTIAPNTDSKVTVKFIGLLMLKSSFQNRLDVGIHRFTSDHTFQVILVVDKPGLPLTVFRLLTGPLVRPFTMVVTPPAPSGVQAFVSAASPFVRSDAVNHQLDSRWALNLRIPHPNADFNDGARPIATLNGGTLYSSNLTRPTLTPELVQDTSRTPMIRLAADLAVAIDLPADGAVTCAWDELGVGQRVILPREHDPEGTKYTIVLMNDPPISSPAPHDELAHYYKVLVVAGAPIQNLQRCRLNFSSRPKTDEIPCLPIVLNS